MKTRFLITLATIFASAFAAHAATVDEIIAQFPAQDAATANSLFEQLLDLDDDAIEGLCTRLVPLGAGDDNAVRYALTGLARYVSRPGAEAGREVVEEALLEGLEANTSAECRAFLLRQLQQCGGDETVSEIGGLLRDDAVASYAILTLDAICTNEANKVLARGLRKASHETKLQILSAMADNSRTSVYFHGSPFLTANKTARKLLAANPDPDECVHLLSILAAIGGPRVLDPFIEAMDRPEPRCRKAALVLASKWTSEETEKRWRKKMEAEGTSDEAKAEIAKMLAESK